MKSTNAVIKRIEIRGRNAILPSAKTARIATAPIDGRSWAIIRFRPFVRAFQARVGRRDVQTRLVRSPRGH